MKKIMQRKEELQNEISNLKLKILKEEGNQNKLKEEYENADKKVSDSEIILSAQCFHLTHSFLITVERNDSKI